jgi:putative ubiquitin-RnfH superfamily antitoxin RatB of RatAB toxin-antitoxin module
MAKAEGPAPLKVSIVYSPAPRQVRQWAVELAAGTTVAQALAASGILKEFPELQGTRPVLGIWGRKTTPGHRADGGRPPGNLPRLACRPEGCAPGTV